MMTYDVATHVSNLQLLHQASTYPAGQIQGQARGGGGREGGLGQSHVLMICAMKAVLHHPLTLHLADGFTCHARLQLAQCLKTELGMQQLLKSLEDSKDRGAALAFLATAVKDHGAVPTCIKLFQYARFVPLNIAPETA
jgi:hypothetical protein